MFSIVTPSYNSAHYIKRCIGSVKIQKFIPREHLIMDGMSNDNTLNYFNDCKKILNHDPSYKLLFKSRTDNGMYDAINNGWSKSSGEILSWLNCDEQYLPNTLSYVDDIFKKNPLVDVVYGNAIIVDKNGDLISAKKELSLNKFLISNTFLNIFSCTIFFRRRLWDSGILRLNDELKAAADMDLILKLLRNKVKMYHCKKYLSLFVLDGENKSLQPESLIETELVRDNYTILPKKIRHCAKYLRYFLRTISGHYRKEFISYDYAVDDIPNYISKTGLSNGRFKF